MRIFVKVRPKARQEEVKRIDGDHFIVKVKEPPQEGKANEAVIRAIAEYFHVSKSQVAIVSGFTAREKILEIAS